MSSIPSLPSAVPENVEAAASPLTDTSLRSLNCLTGSPASESSSDSTRKASLGRGSSMATTIIADNTTAHVPKTKKSASPLHPSLASPEGGGHANRSNAGSPTGTGKGNEANGAGRVGTPPHSPKSKKLNVFSALFGECLCAENFRLPERGHTPAAQFVKLDGVECIALGAVIDEQTAQQRVTETVRQLATSTKRLISIGYLLDAADVDIEHSMSDGIVDNAPSSPLLALATNGTSSPTGITGTSPTIRFDKVTESIPLEVWTKNYPDDTSMSKKVRNTIDHIKQKEFDAALADFEGMLREQKAHPKRNDNDYLLGMTVHNIAVIHLLAGNNDKALPLFREAVTLKKSTFGKNHPEVAVSLDEIGIQLFAKEKFEQALAIFNEARRIRIKGLGSNHPKVAMVLNNIACCNFQMGNPLAALVMFQEARDILQHALGTSAKAELDLLHVATTLCNLGYMKLRLKQYDEARTVFEEALLIQQSVLGDNHKTIKDTLSNMDFSNAFHS